MHLRRQPDLVDRGRDTVGMERPPLEKWTPERRRQLTRDALVTAARDVFARRGFHAASLDEIAEAAGFTRGAVYSNFEGKEDLFFAVQDRHVEVQLAGFQDFFDEAGGPNDVDPAAMAQAWQRITGGTDREWMALSLEFRLYALRNPEVRERFVSQYRRIRDVVVGYMSSMIAQIDFELAIPITDLAAIVDWAAGGLMELSELDPSESHVLETFLGVIDRGAFIAPDTGAS
jgi:AcrR family transcriptional regulator